MDQQLMSFIQAYTNIIGTNKKKKKKKAITSYTKDISKFLIDLGSVRKMGLHLLPIWEYFAIVAPELLITNEPGNLIF